MGDQSLNGYNLNGHFGEMAGLLYGGVISIAERDAFEKKPSPKVKLNNLGIAEFSVVVPYVNTSTAHARESFAEFVRKFNSETDEFEICATEDGNINLSFWMRGVDATQFVR